MAELVNLDMRAGLQTIADVEASRTKHLGVNQGLLVDAGVWWCENGRLVEDVMRRYAAQLGDARRLQLEVLEFFAGPDEPTVARVDDLFQRLRAFEARFPAQPYKGAPSA